MDNLYQNIQELFLNNKYPEDIVGKFKERIKQNKLTIQENPESHFCIFFAAYDPGAKEVFIGHHKKSGLWLLNGGHIDRGETIQETLVREIDEEWGLDAKNFEIGDPGLLTITEINNPTKQTCKRHYDIWFFVPTQKEKFKPNAEKVSEEFYQADWMTIDEARKKVEEKNTLIGVDFIENNYF